MSEKDPSLRQRKWTVAKIYAIEAPVLEMGRRLKNKLSPPRVKKTQAEKELLPLAVLDIFRGQTVYKIYQVLEKNLLVVFVPSNCSGKLQPLAC